MTALLIGKRIVCCAHPVKLTPKAARHPLNTDRVASNSPKIGILIGASLRQPLAPQLLPPNWSNCHGIGIRLVFKGALACPTAKAHALFNPG
jgi:hypothetical protein